MRALVIVGMYVASGVLAGSISGCASVASDGDRRDPPAEAFAAVVLTATPYNAGRIGRAYLLPKGDRTAVRIEASGVPETVARPIHLYTFIYEGSCAARSEKAAFALTETVLASSLANPTGIGAFGGPLTITNAAPIAFDALRAKPYAIVVKTSPALKDQVDVWGELSGSRSLMRAVKARFDPNGTLSPGRGSGGV